MLAFKRIAMVLVLFSLIIANANAFVSGVPNAISFHELPRDFTFSVSNEEGVDRTLKVELFFPLEHQFVKKPGVIRAQETETVTIRFFPRRDLLASEFVGTLKITLGTNTAEKNIKMRFLPQNSCPVSINTSVKISEQDGQKKFLVLSKLQNHKQEQAKISFKKIEGLSQSWVVDAEELKKIGPFEKKSHQIVLTPQESFEGEIEVVYNCEGFVEKRTVKVSHDNGEAFFSGLASLFSIDFGAGELLLNIILIFIAAVLLIAFIARLVRKLSGTPNTQLNYQAQAPQTQGDYQYSSLSNNSLEELKRKISEK